MQTAVGSRHETNEDALGEIPERSLWLVADGMGGHAAGDVASALVRDRIVQGVADGEDLSDAIHAAHQDLTTAAAADPERKGMGSTVVAVQLHDTTAQIAWVGDSRVYLLREGRLRQLTRDHSLVQWLVDRGEITADEAEQHPDRNVLIRTLGFEQPVADRATVELEAGDVLLLCSDGVTAEVDDAGIGEILRGSENAQAAADALIDAVTARQGKDDASAIVLRMPPADAVASRVWLPAAVGFGVGLLIYLILNWMKSS